MKDEELFNAWKSEQYKDQSTEERLEFVEHLHTFPKYFEKTFLAGLKAGRPQWHKVADGDLPKEDKQYLVLFYYNYKGKKEMSYGVRDNLHSDFEIHRCYTEQIIAWCEIPKFEEAAE